MTGKLPPVDPGQGSFDQFQLEIVGEAARIPPNQRQGALEKLSKCVPQNEGGWREAREWHSFLAPVDICKKVLSFVKEGPLSQELQRFLYIAVCCVDRHLGDKSKAYEDYRSRVHTEKLTEFTINNYMSVVLGIISLMDELYLGGYRHRAFEAVLLYSPLSISYLNHYKQAPDEFKACFPTCQIQPEVQASLPLYLPFIIKYRHPKYRYSGICEALHTSILSEREYDKFVSVLESGKPIPRMLPLPNEAQPPDTPVASSSAQTRYDPVRDAWDHDPHFERPDSEKR